MTSKIKDMIVIFFIFSITTCCFVAYRDAMPIVWNDTIHTVWYLYDREVHAEASIASLPDRFKRSFGAFQSDGYRPLSQFIYDYGITSFLDPMSPPHYWEWFIGLIFGLMAASLYIYSKTVIQSTLFSLLSVGLCLFSPPVITASWVLYAGIQAFVLLVICTGLILYNNVINSPKRKLSFLFLVVVMFVGPWFREFCGILPLLIIVSEIIRRRKPTVLMVVAAIFFLHSLFPMALVKWFVYNDLELKSVFNVGSLGKQISVSESGYKSYLLNSLQNIRWHASWNFLVLIPPVLYIVSLFSFIVEIIRRKVTLPLLVLFICFGLSVIYLALVARSENLLGLTLSLGIALISLQWSVFLSIWFLISYLPFLKVYTEQVHLAYCIVPATIILCLSYFHLWSFLKGKKSGGIIAAKYTMIFLLSLGFLDQAINLYSSRVVVSSIYEGIIRVGQWFENNTPNDSIVITNVLHGEDIRLYAKNHFSLYWTVGAGISDSKRCLEDQAVFQNFYDENINRKKMYFLDMEFSRLPQKESYHRHKYLHPIPICPVVDLGVIYFTKVRYPYLDPLKWFTKREYISFLGPPDLVDDFYTGNGEDEHIGWRETSVYYHVYRLSTP